MKERRRRRRRRKVGAPMDISARRVHEIGHYGLFVPSYRINFRK
jgi:hypothetical protein